MEKDRQEMGGAYDLLFATVEWHLRVGRSLIITATFSRKSLQGILVSMCGRYTGARMRVIQCLPVNDTPEEVALRMARRTFGEGGQKGAVNSPERYFEVKGRYNAIEIPHLVLPTWGSRDSVDDCAEEALFYVLS